jgi:hypothetical protein
MEELLFMDTLDVRDGCIRRGFNEQSEFNEYYMQQEILNL